MRTHRPLLKLITLAGVLVAMPFFVGCDDEKEPSSGAVEGSLLRLPAGDPIGGTEIFLLRHSNLTVASGPVLTDSTGSYRFSEVTPGRYYVYAFVTADVVFDLSEPTVMVTAGETSTYTIRMIASRLWDGDGIHVSGTVTDAATGDPLPGAFVTTNLGNLDFNIAGLLTPWDQITDARGRFLLEDVPSVLFVARARNLPLAWIYVTKEGYEPSIVSGLSSPQPPDSVTVANVALSRLGAGRSLAGTVTSAQLPVEGVRVMLDYFVVPPTLTVRHPTEKAPLLGHVAVSDSDGSFRFDNLIPGTYQIHAGADLDDGWTQRFPVEVTLSESDSTGIQLEVHPAIDPVAPLPGAVIEDTTPLLEWKPVPGAASYVVQVGTGHLLTPSGPLSEAQWQWPASAPLSSTKRSPVRWSVTAQDTSGAFLGSTETMLGFEVQPALPGS